MNDKSGEGGFVVCTSVVVSVSDSGLSQDFRCHMPRELRGGVGTKVITTVPFKGTNQIHGKCIVKLSSGPGVTPRGVGRVDRVYDKRRAARSELVTLTT